MDNYIDSLGEPDESQPQPKPEETPPPAEPEGTFETSSFSEPQEQPDTPEIPKGPGKDDRMWAAFCHLAAFACYFIPLFGLVLGPLIIWLIKKEDSPFVDVNGKKALNFQISIVIYMLAASPLICLLPVYIIVVACLGVLDVIYIIISAIKANSGKEVSYPVSIEFIK